MNFLHNFLHTYTVSYQLVTHLFARCVYLTFSMPSVSSLIQMFPIVLVHGLPRFKSLAFYYYPLSLKEAMKAKTNYRQLVSLPNIHYIDCTN